MNAARPLARAALAPVLLAALLHAPVSAQQPSHAAEPVDRIQRVERGLLPTVRVRGRHYEPATVQERMRHHGVPAVSIAVVRDGRIEWARAYGMADVESGRAATPATLFQAASMSKAVAALAALRLVEQGRLDLDQDVNRYLRSWRLPESEHTAERPVTLRDLLSHSAGLTVHGFPGYAAGEPLPSTAQVLDGSGPANTDPVRSYTRPGTEWRYSGGGTTVVQQVLEDVTGRPFPALMRELVLDPAGMRASTYAQPLPDSLAGRAAHAYGAGMEPVPGRWHAYPEMAAAGLWTTPSDLARYILEVQAALAGEPGRVLSREMAERMITPGPGQHGLGPSIAGEGDGLTFEHGGANRGFRGQFAGFVHGGDGVVVMTNSDAGMPLAMELTQAVVAEYGWPGFRPREIVPVPVAAETLASYPGRYLLDRGERGTAEIPVELRDGTLVLALPTGEIWELIPTGPDEFTETTRGTAVRFERGVDGQVEAMVIADRQRLRRSAPN